MKRLLLIFLASCAPLYANIWHTPTTLPSGDKGIRLDCIATSPIECLEAAGALCPFGAIFISTSDQIDYNPGAGLSQWGKSTEKVSHMVMIIECENPKTWLEVNQAGYTWWVKNDALSK